MDKTPAASNSRTVSWLAAAALVAGNMIGTGVFTSLGFQVVDVPSGFGIVLLWVLGGVIAWCGALAYAELGTMAPRSGGEYHLLGLAWPPVIAFMAGWVSLVAGFAAPVALASTAFGEYAANSVFGGSAVASRGCALAVLAVVTAAHLNSVRLSGRFQLAATALKMALIVGLIGAGWLAPAHGTLTFLPRAEDWALISHAPFVTALFFVSFAYSGWNAATYVAEELENPARDLPKALLLGTAVVTALYVLFNAALLRTVPAQQLAGRVDVAQSAAQYLFGDTGGRVLGGLIALGLVSTISAMMWAGPRVAAVMGRDWLLFAPLARTSITGVPRVALAFQFAVAALFIGLGGFKQVLTYLEFTLSLFTFLTVLGLFLLRRRQPQTPRPFRAWGYPVTPLLFLLATGYALVRFATSPEQARASLLGAGTVAAGGVLYWWQVKRRAALAQLRREGGAAQRP